MAESIRITIYYRWAGQRWFFRIRSEGTESGLAVGRLLFAHPDSPLELEVKPWLSHLWGA